nr:probable inactive methyltransferase Os04g0175900 [Aegilops tauschii subsp. strangulata]
MGQRRWQQELMSRCDFCAISPHGLVTQPRFNKVVAACTFRSCIGEHPSFLHFIYSELYVISPYIYLPSFRHRQGTIQAIGTIQVSMDNNTVRGSRMNPAAGDDDEGTWLHAWGLITSFAVSMTLKAAIELGIFHALSNAGSLAITADELAARLPTMDKAGGLAPVDRIMRLLASFDIVKCVTEAGPSGEVIRHYKPSPVCRWLSSNHGGPSLAPYSMFTTDQDFLMAW